jgi:hypothetical protein
MPFPLKATLAAVLSGSKHDDLALQAKCFALIMMGRHSEALDVACLPEMAKCLHFEKSYCCWKVNGASAALTELEAAESEGEQHLKALLLMRKARADEALTLYQHLLPQAKGDKQAVCEMVR